MSTHPDARSETGRATPPAIVKNAASRHFSAVDLAAGEVVADLGEGRYPHTAVFHPDQPLAYLLYISSAHLEVVDLTRLETVQRYDDLGTMPVGSALSADADRFYVGTAVENPGGDDPGVVALDLDDEGLVESATQRSFARAAGMRVGPAGYLYVAQKTAAEVLALDADLEVAARIPAGAKPHDMYVLPDLDLLVVNNAGEAAATLVDLAAQEVRCTAATGQNPHGFARADGPDYRYGLFPAREDDRLAVVDLDAAVAGVDEPTTALLDLGTSTGFADVTPDGRHAIVDSYDDSHVTVIDLASLEVAATVEVGGEPLHVVFAPDGRSCYVGNMARDEVAVLETAPLLDGRPDDVTVARRIPGLGAKPSGIFLPEVTA